MYHNNRQLGFSVLGHVMTTAKYSSRTRLSRAPASNEGSFLNDFYDDEGWWAMVSGSMISRQSSITSMLQKNILGYGEWCLATLLAGGLRKRRHTAIAIELYIADCRLTLQSCGDQKSYFEDMATRERELVPELRPY